MPDLTTPDPRVQGALRIGHPCPLAFWRYPT